MKMLSPLPGAKTALPSERKHKIVEFKLGKEVIRIANPEDEIRAL